MNTCEWLDKVKEEKQIVSDYKLGKSLGIAPSRVSGYRISNTQMGDELALKIEKLLKLPAGTVLLDMHAERTKCVQASKVFKKLAKELTSAAASLLITIVMLNAVFYPSESMAIATDQVSNNVYYVKWLIDMSICINSQKMYFFTLFLLNRILIRYLTIILINANKTI